jgi:soluble lytic murein transglycosylase
MRSRVWILAILVVVGCAGESMRRPPSPAPPTATPSATPTPEPYANLAQAVALMSDGQDAQALPLLTDLLATEPVLTDYYLHFLAAIAQRAGRDTDAAALDARLAAEYPESVWIPHLLARGAARARATEPAEAAVLVERSLAHPDNDAASRALALLTRGELRAATDPRAAYRIYHDVRRLGGPPAERARAHTRALDERYPGLLADVDLQLAESAMRAAEGRRDLAAERLTALAAAVPVGSRWPVLSELAQTLRLAERYDDAIAVLRRAVELDPSPSSPARLQLAFRLWSQDHDAEARALFETLLRESPNHPSATTMRYALARIAEERGDLDDALPRYRAIARGQGMLADEAQWRLGWAPYRAGRLRDAAAGFAAVERRSVDDRIPALYWMGRIAERSDTAAEAATKFETVLAREPKGYYGGLAEARLGRPLTPAPLAEPYTAAPPPASTTGDRHWTRRTALLEANLTTLAAREVDAWARGLVNADRRAPFMLSVYTAVGAHTRARAHAHTLMRHGTITLETRLAYDYPLAYWSHVEPTTTTIGLDPYLLLAIMRQESQFDPEALSPVGARGLMQLMPNTAAQIVGHPVDLRALADPATNIDLGARYLRHLLDRYDGRVPWAIAAYNAGEHAVDKWVRREDDIAPDEFVESVTYRETRAYAKIVLANLRRYRQLYPR